MHDVLKKFSVYELVLIAIMSALGIAVKPIVVPIAHLIAGPLMIPGGALAGGFYMLWLVVGFGLIGKYGTGTLISLVQAFMILFVGVSGSHGIMSLFSYSVSGFLMDLTLFLIGHRVCCLPCALIAGAVANVSGTFAVNLIFFRLPVFFLLMTIAVSVLSGAAGGFLAWELLKVLNASRIPGSYCEQETAVKTDSRESDTLPDSAYTGSDVPAIFVNNLSLSYDQKRFILKNISLAVPKGTITVILGLSGCGKTTLCHCLNGIIPFCRSAFVSGAVYLMGERVGVRTLGQMAETVGTVLQNPDDQMVASTVEDELAFGLENQCVDPEEIRNKVLEVLDLLKIRDLRFRNPVRLSGGQKHLVAIASQLVLNPDILIMDEPLSHLDEDGQLLVKDCIRKLKDMGKTIVIVEHNYSSMEFADQWIVMANGEVLETGKPEDLLVSRKVLCRAQLEPEEGAGGWN